MWQDILNTLSTWIQQHPDILAWAVGISVLTFIGTLIAVPVAIINMPADYFLQNKIPTMTLSPLHLIGRLLKNSLGLLLLVMGIIMLFMPGQGLLTMLLGVSLIDFPGKRALELRLVRRHSIQQSINWIRHRAQKPPLQLP